MQSTSVSWQKAAEELPEETITSAWKPEKGEAIAGKILSIEHGVGQEGNSSLAHLETQDGNPIMVWLTAVLKKEFTRLQLEPGDVVGIKYCGEHPSKKGKPYKAFNVTVIERRVKDADDFQDGITF